MHRGIDGATLRHTLAVLGYRRLDKFLASPEWLAIENRLLEERPTCQHCHVAKSRKILLGGADLMTLSGQRDERLTAVCPSCFTLATYRAPEPKAPWEKRKANRFIPANRIRQIEQSRGATSFNRLNRQQRADSAAREERRQFRAKRAARRQRRIERRKQRKAAVQA